MLLITLYKVVLTLESVDQILKCDHSNESYWTVLSRGVVYYAVQDGSNFRVCRWNPVVTPFKRQLSSISSQCFNILHNVISESCDSFQGVDLSRQVLDHAPKRVQGPVEHDPDSADACSGGNAPSCRWPSVWGRYWYWCAEEGPVENVLFWSGQAARYASADSGTDKDWNWTEQEGEMFQHRFSCAVFTLGRNMFGLIMNEPVSLCSVAVSKNICNIPGWVNTV